VVVEPPRRDSSDRPKPIASIAPGPPRFSSYTSDRIAHVAHAWHPMDPWGYKTPKTQPPSSAAAVRPTIPFPFTSSSGLVGSPYGIGKTPAEFCLPKVKKTPSQRAKLSQHPAGGELGGITLPSGRVWLMGGSRGRSLSGRGAPWLIGDIPGWSGVLGCCDRGNLPSRGTPGLPLASPARSLPSKQFWEDARSWEIHPPAIPLPDTHPGGPTTRIPSIYLFYLT
jgi:hypothetical protein